MMEKEQADKIIAEYMKKIYGFTLSRTMDIDLAEEIASEITYEVYKALLKVENTYNVNSYIYRIAHNVHHRFLSEGKHFSQIFTIDDKVSDRYDYEKDKIFSQLRKEIAYLSNLQREIVVLYYFDKLSLVEISKRLKLPHGTVKWHLFEARNKIKESFDTSDNNIKSEEDTLNPHLKSFKKMRYYGFSLLTKNLDMSFYFQKKISQNIAFSTYRKPKTAIEISKELNIPTTFIEDEISNLAENGFLNKVPGNKYLTNIYIMEQREKELEIKINKLYKKYAEYVCDMYIPHLSPIPNPLSPISNPLSPIPYPLTFTLLKMTKIFFYGR